MVFLRALVGECWVRRPSAHGGSDVNGPRRRHQDARDPRAESICLLTPERASRRRAPIDRVLDAGSFELAPNGYRIRLPRSDASWLLANQFVDEEPSCCPSLSLDVAEEPDAIVVRAEFEGLARA